MSRMWYPVGTAGRGFFLVSPGGRIRSGVATMYLLLAHASVLLAKDRLSSGLFSFLFFLSFFHSDTIAFSDWGWGHLPQSPGQDIKKEETEKT